MCDGREQLAFALDTYDRQQQAAGSKDGCDFSGSATAQSTAAPSGACASKISAAGDGTKSTASGGSSGSTSTGTSRGAATMGTTQASLHIGSLQIGIYMVCALMSGAGMILL